MDIKTAQEEKKKKPTATDNSLMVSPFQKLSIIYPTILKCLRWEREPGSTEDNHIGAKLDWEEGIWA